jgi:hypothetical protein
LLVNIFSNTDPPENIGWWVSELTSLGVDIRKLKIKELDNIQVLSNLTENIKQALFEEYKLSMTVLCKEGESNY